MITYLPRIVCVYPIIQLTESLESKTSHEYGGNLEPSFDFFYPEEITEELLMFDSIYDRFKIADLRQGLMFSFIRDRMDWDEFMKVWNYQTYGNYEFQRFTYEMVERYMNIIQENAKELVKRLRDPLSMSFSEVIS